MNARLLAGLVLYSAACGSSGSPPAPTAIDAGPYSYRTCDPANRVGEFRIDLEDTFTTVTGTIASAPIPAEVPKLIKEAGVCRLVGVRNLFCDPACGSDQTCGDAGKCIPYPPYRSAGTVSITGLAAPVTMMPSAHGLHYDYNMLPQPGFAPGAEIQLRASGADVAPFLLQGRGVTPLEISIEGTVLERGKDLVLHWTAGPPGPARIAFELRIDQHGQTRATLACDVPDEGTATVGSDLIDELISLGVAGFPTIQVARRTVDATTLAGGCVELVVMTAVERTITVSGHTPCHADADCPAGKTCALDIETCR